MAGTFLDFAKRADFNAATPASRAAGTSEDDVAAPEGVQESVTPAGSTRATGGITLGSLVYSIQIHLPESRDQAVYDGCCEA
jgi:hypothetical protein